MRRPAGCDGVTAGWDSKKPPVRIWEETQTKYEGQLSTSWALAAQPLHRCRFFINQSAFFLSSHHITQRARSLARCARRLRHCVGKLHPTSTPLRLIAGYVLYPPIRWASSLELKLGERRSNSRLTHPSCLFFKLNIHPSRRLTCPLT